MNKSTKNKASLNAFVFNAKISLSSVPLIFVCYIWLPVALFTDTLSFCFSSLFVVCFISNVLSLEMLFNNRLFSFKQIVISFASVVFML